MLSVMWMYSGSALDCSVGWYVDMLSHSSSILITQSWAAYAPSNFIWGQMFPLIGRLVTTLCLVSVEFFKRMSEYVIFGQKK